MMLNAGIPIVEALKSLEEDSPNKNSKKLLAEMSKGITEGKSLSEVLNYQPDTFDPVFISIAKSGETGGNLDKVLSQLAANLKANIDSINNIKSALFYPTLVLIVLAGVSFYMFAFALPKIGRVFLDLKVPLPAYSKFILLFSLFFQKYYIFFGIGMITLVFFFIRLLAVSKVRRIILSVFSHIPSLNLLIKYSDLYRFANTASLLIKSGIPIIQVLEISQNVVISPKLRNDIGFVKNILTQGTTIAEAMAKRTESFPSLIRRVIAVGEETGNLDKSFDEVSTFYEKKFTDSIKNIIVLIEPIFLIAVSIVVAIVLLSVITPIYQLIGQIKR